MPKAGHFARVKSARQSIRRRKPSVPTEGWSIVLLDGEPIRRKARRDYDKMRRELDKAKAEAERFETADKPQFERWMNANFGALLTEIRDLQGKLIEVQGLVNEVQQEFYYGNYRSINTAYKKVMKRRSQPEPEEAQEPPMDEEAEKQFRREFEETFGKTDDEFWRRLSGEPEEIEKSPPPRGAESSRMKELYRRLVRRLHPDKGGKRSTREIEWWHQTQEAYGNGNVEQLELIITLVEMEDKGSKEASISVLTQLTVEFKKSLRSLKRKLSSFKNDVAWNFSQMADFSGLLDRVRAKLSAERDHIQWLVQKYDTQIKSWEVAGAPSGRRTARRGGTWQDEEWF